MNGGDDAILELLLRGEMEIRGEFMWGSNYTFLAEVTHAGETTQAVYKPSRGERPLWDFPPATLARREVAAYLVSEALGWRLVPPTVYRKQGPLGPGSLQLYIAHDPEYHYFTFSEEDRQRLRPAAAFDLLINNADRKGSHVLVDPDGHLWLIDHGVCFHVEDKLRTVIWDFVGQPLGEDLCIGLAEFHDRLNDTAEGETALAQSLKLYLTRAEIKALRARAEKLVTQPVFPQPDPYRRPYPWPQI
jgi:uncharacterized repeat protein (TIGR03843 family)